MVWGRSALPLRGGSGTGRPPWRQPSPARAGDRPNCYARRHGRPGIAGTQRVTAPVMGGARVNLCLRCFLYCALCRLSGTKQPGRRHTEGPMAWWPQRASPGAGPPHAHTFLGLNRTAARWPVTIPSHLSPQPPFFPLGQLSRRREQGRRQPIGATRNPGSPTPPRNQRRSVVYSGCALEHPA